MQKSSQISSVINWFGQFILWTYSLKDFDKHWNEQKPFIRESMMEAGIGEWKKWHVHRESHFLVYEMLFPAKYDHTHWNLAGIQQRRVRWGQTEQNLFFRCMRCTWTIWQIFKIFIVKDILSLTLFKNITLLLQIHLFHYSCSLLKQLWKSSFIRVPWLSQYVELVQNICFSWPFWSRGMVRSCTEPDLLKR